MDEQERSQQELEFILDGITTRMQMAMEKITESNREALGKISESNKLLHSAVKWVCAVSIVIVFVLGAIIILNKAG